ncbi:hypothetical protein [Methylobacterium frigidaeris]|uniref:Uncharacterized protein n=1 Tax=Methylobacterium frigidaeris TaxID=2038277 RepID=A0AA37HH92_9HYPH|nr:hypothetical protein [Methylobacterium frigidaeris]PIK70533.1 hypothetical protein CS379_24185 [Methylobacterium frigidaeris]GJD65130.1 hypothetical protein MPEAHAMD_5317 [Methylobacterium frigidaeris]
MKFLTLDEARKALVLALAIARKAEATQDIVLDPIDAELIILGLFLIVRTSEHAPHFPEVFFGAE